MSAHVFHEVFLHVNWHTKEDRPMLAGDMEGRVHEKLRQRCRETKGVYLHEIGGTDDHVHLVLSIEPSVCISDLLGALKGGSSHDINDEEKRISLQWQRGFGVVSFGKRNLPWVIDYVARQREHHASGRIHERLEGFNDLPG